MQKVDLKFFSTSWFKSLVLCFVLLMCGINTSAQYVKGYNIPDSTYQQKHLPPKATFMSAVLPGLGQAYNKKYWKIPVIYAGFTGLGYYTGYNNYVYKRYKDAYETKIKIDAGDSTLTDPLPNISTDATLKSREEWRRYRDLTIIGIGLLYVAQIIDANVDAHLFDYDISEDLSMRIEPVYIDPRSAIYTFAGQNNNSTIGFKATISF